MTQFPYVSEVYAEQVESGRPILLGKISPQETFDGRTLWRDVVISADAESVTVQRLVYPVGLLAENRGDTWPWGAPKPTVWHVIRLPVGMDPSHLPGWRAAYYG